MAMPQNQYTGHIGYLADDPIFIACLQSDLAPARKEIQPHERTLGGFQSRRRYRGWNKKRKPARTAVATQGFLRRAHVRYPLAPNFNVAQVCFGEAAARLTKVGPPTKWNIN